MTIADRFYQKTLDLLARDQLVLPSRPEVAIKVATLTQDPDVSTAKLAAELGKDPALAARLLRVAASAGQGGRKIESLAQAITRLGMQMTQLLVTGLAVEQAYKSRVPGINVVMQRRWKESAKIASVARVLAAECSLQNPDLAMLAGLMHDIGALPVLRLAETEGYTDPSTLELVMETLSGRIGVLILQAWQFPPELAEIPAQCRASAPPGGGPAEMADIVIAARLNARFGMQSHNAPAEFQAAFTRLGFDPPDCALDGVAARAPDLLAA